MKRTSSNLIPLWHSVVVLGAVALCGCSAMETVRNLDFDLDDRIPWSSNSDDPLAPKKLIAIWTDTVLHQTDKDPLRGFGGRVMFYRDESGEPCKVDGMLVVYAFRENGREPDDVKPDRKFVFPADMMERHYSKSKLGHSYSFWLPFDTVGGEQQEYSLIVRFTPKQGPIVVGEQTRHVLPGRTPLVKPAAVAPVQSPEQAQAGMQRSVDGEIRRVGYQGEVVDNQGASTPSAGRMQTVTIPLSAQANALWRQNQSVGPAMPANGPAAAMTPAAGMAKQSQLPAGSVTVPAVNVAPIGPSNSATPAAAQPGPPSAHWSPGTRRALGEPIARPTREHGQWPPRRAMWQHGQ